jgi:hypothetical protein
MRTLIKSYRLFLSFSVCHLIILWALAAGCANGTLDATHLKVLELLFCLCTFEPWRARNRRHYPLRAAVLLYHNCTGVKLHALLVPVPPAGQPCHFVVLRQSSLWCHHQLNRVKLTQSCWKGLWWIKRISKSYRAARRFFFCRAWESRGPCCTADIECFLSFWRDDYSSPRVHLHWKQVKVEQRAAIFFFFFSNYLTFSVCVLPLLPIHGDCRCGKQSDAEKETRYIFCLIVAPWADDVACDRPCNDRIVFSIWKARRVIPMPCRRYCHIPDDIQMLFPVGVSKALLKTKALFMTYYYVLVLCSDGLLSLYLAAVYTCQPLKYVTIMGSNKLSANVFFLSLLFRFLFLPFLCWWARCLCLDLEFIFVSEPERESDRVY